MAKYDYSKRLENMKKRRHDSEALEKSVLGKHEIMNESYEMIKDTPTIKYVIGAMQPVSDNYTKITYSEAERVKNQLRKLEDMAYDIEFKYQGSVTNNTHIRAHSDIDILTLHLGFITLESPQKAEYPYKGDPVKDLCNLREDSFSLLRSAYPTVNIDNEGAKSISLSGGSLRRKVDVVPSNWYDTVLYKRTNLDHYRGVMVLDYKKKERFANSPFYHNKLIDNKDISSAGNFKKVVRLLKTLKADSDQQINLSSYDITALMYHMDDSKYWVGRSPLKLIKTSLDFLKLINYSDEFRNKLLVPDGSRRIFEPNRASNEDLRLLILELEWIYQDLLDDLKHSVQGIDKEIIVA